MPVERRQGLALRHLGPIGARVGLAAGLQQSADIGLAEQIDPPPTSVTLAITGSSGCAQRAELDDAARRPCR